MQGERAGARAHVEHRLDRAAHGQAREQARAGADPDDVVCPQTAREVGRDQQPVERVEPDPRTHDTVSDDQEVGEVARCKRSDCCCYEVGVDRLAAQEEPRLNEQRLLGLEAKRQSRHAFCEPDHPAGEDGSAEAWFVVARSTEDLAQPTERLCASSRQGSLRLGLLLERVPSYHLSVVLVV
jgi:hypothetical protein